MDTVAIQSRRIVSGMSPTGPMHLGHYFGVLKNWISLQHEYDCFFFVADWHALAKYQDPKEIENNVWDMVIDWIAAGIEPSATTLFLQSKVAEHAELNLLLSMVTPVAWLERLPAYRHQQEKVSQLSTHGLLGYPLLQTADILTYRAGQVAVGEDQVSHVEVAREIARRFNYIYGREQDFEEKAEAAIKKLGKKNAKLYTNLRAEYLEQGNNEALETARELLKSQQNLALGDSERLFGYLDGGGKIILPEPQALLTEAPNIPGTDGRKMSNSLNNYISLRDSDDVIASKVRSMPDISQDTQTSPVEELLAVFQSGDEQAATSNSKETLIELISAELQPMRERVKELAEHPEDVRRIIDHGSEEAREIAEETLEEVRAAMGINYK